LNFTVADPGEIVSYAINAIKFQARQKQILIESHGSANVSKVHVDVEKTAWVLINFLSNPLRYSA
jgi:signal transduction histidine kinase